MVCLVHLDPVWVCKKGSEGGTVIDVNMRREHAGTA